MILLAGLIGVVLLYFVGRAAAVIWKGYGWSEMDWNGDGRTSIHEFFASSDIGKRVTSRAGVECIEYYSYKDGLPVKVSCPPRM